MSDLEARIAEVLGAHRKKLGIRDGRRHCTCGWTATGLLVDELHKQHQGDHLAALIREAQAEAWEEGNVAGSEDQAAWNGNWHEGGHVEHTNPYKEES